MTSCTFPQADIQLLMKVWKTSLLKAIAKSADAKIANLNPGDFHQQ